MLKRICLILIAMVSLTIFYGCSGGGGETLTIFAAAGAKPGMDEVCRRFEEKYDISVAVTYGGGGEVLSQMTLSRSGDIYVAPEQRFMDMAVAQEAVAPETITTVAYMVPVIAVAKGNPLDILCCA